jgi:O-antigen/teichoic acid export membrane protein
MTLKQKTVAGVLWTGMAKLVLQGSMVIIMIILARLLNVEDFGVLGMAPLLTVAISMINDRGFGTAIIQSKHLQKDHLSSVFWGGIIFGFFLSLVTYLISEPSARFLNEPRLGPVIAVLGSGFIIGAFAVVQRSLLQREMKFKLLAIVEVITVIISGGVAIVMAYQGFGVWSLVSNILIKYGSEAAILWFICHWQPQFHFRYSEFKKHIRFSGNVMAMDLSTYVDQNADITIIEKVLGSGLLGFYSFAMNLVKIPITRLSSIVSKVVFPAFAVVQDDMAKFTNGYLKSMKLISVITFPVLAILALLSREFILVFLTAKWMPMQLPLLVLTPMAMLKSIGTIRAPVLMARGRPDILVIWNVIYFVPLVGVVYWGTRYGLAGVSVSFTILYLVTFPIIQYLTDRQVGITQKQFLGSITSTTFATLIMVVAGLGFKYLVGHVFNFSSLAVLLTCSLFSFGVYFGSLWFFDRKILQEMYQLLSSQSKKMRKDDYISKISEIEMEL